jgi:VanZ family protein
MKKGLYIHLVVVALISGAAYLGLLQHVHGPHIPFLDKVLHFLFVGGIAFWWTAGWDDPRLRLARVAVPIALVAPVALATVDETAQLLFPHRNFDPFDWLANVLGVLTFWWLARRLRTPHPVANSS